MVQRLQKQEQWLPIHVILHDTYFHYHLQDDGIVMHDKITGKIDDIISGHPLAHIYICGDFNIHHKESTQTTYPWRRQILSSP